MCADGIEQVSAILSVCSKIVSKHIQNHKSSKLLLKQYYLSSKTIFLLDVYRFADIITRDTTLCIESFGSSTLYYLG